MSYAALTVLFALVLCSIAFDIGRSDNLAVYWGQDSAGNQQRLSYYCKDDSIDIIPLAFLYIFYGEGGQPVIDFADSCNQYDNSTFSGTQLADCSQLAADIKACQAKGKIVTISLGGATGQVGLKDDTQAADFADTIWNEFLGGSSKTRPFGSAVLDGVDLDIESGSDSHYAAFVNRIRSRAKGASKKYYVTAAPQCPYPDASIGAALNTASFDAVFVQFYNNYCGLDDYPDQFNFDTWDAWAHKVSPNPAVKVFLGAPASGNAASEGYVNISTLAKITVDTRKKYSSFGGVMLWEASEAYTNDRFDRAIKQVLLSGTSSSSSRKTTTSTKARTSTTSKISSSATSPTSRRSSSTIPSSKRSSSSPMTSPKSTSTTTSKKSSSISSSKPSSSSKKSSTTSNVTKQPTPAAKSTSTSKKTSSSTKKTTGTSSSTKKTTSSAKSTSKKLPSTTTKRTSTTVSKTSSSHSAKTSTSTFPGLFPLPFILDEEPFEIQLTKQEE